MMIMKQTKLFTLLAALIYATTMTWAQTFLGSGNSTDPYLLKSSNEWEALAKQVAEGKNFQNQFFRLSADIDTKGIQVRSVDKPFCGTFDGNNTQNGGIAVCIDGEDSTQGTGISDDGATDDNR